MTQQISQDTVRWSKSPAALPHSDVPTVGAGGGISARPFFHHCSWFGLLRYVKEDSRGKKTLLIRGVAGSPFNFSCTETQVLIAAMSSSAEIFQFSAAFYPVTLYWLSYSCFFFPPQESSNLFRQQPTRTSLGGILEAFPGPMKFVINLASEQVSSSSCPCWRELHSLWGAARGGCHLFLRAKVRRFFNSYVPEFSQLQWWRKGAKQPWFPIIWLWVCREWFLDYGFFTRFRGK